MRNVSIFLSLLLGAFAGGALAQAWTGGGTNNNWSTGANWSGGAAPPSAATTALTFGATPRLSPVVDAPWTINRMDFSRGGYSFSGQAITFSGASPGVLVPIAVGLQPIVVANPLVLTGPMSIVNFSILDLTGGISGTGPLTISGAPGFTLLAGSSSFTGGVTIAGGNVLRLAGASLQGPVNVVSGSGLSGGGSIAGAVTVDNGNSWLAPFDETLHTGSLSGSGVMVVSLNGTAQGAQYSHLDVTGTVNLAAMLSLRGTFVPATSTVFTIITNDGTDPVIGTFASLPEGATVMLNGVPLTISYIGGTGNDVTLTAGAPLVAAAQTPTLSHLALLLLAALLPWIGATQLRRR
jgi:hypothetical protein